MVLKNVVPALLGVALLAGSGAMAAEYRADEFLTLDLSKAVLSPNPLGPPDSGGFRSRPSPTTPLKLRRRLPR